MIEAALGHLQRFLWPHLALTLFAMVALDYVAFLARFLQVGLSCYLALQVAAWVFGFAAGILAAVKRLDPPGFAGYRIASLFPLCAAGEAAAAWAISPMSPGPPTDGWDKERAID